MRSLLFVCDHNAGRSQIAHAFAERLASDDRLLPGLVAEFDGWREPAEIRSCADRVLETFDAADVRTYVPVLAEKRTRACERAERCDPWLTGTPA